MADQADAVPTPDGAMTPDEFMVRLRQLKEWTGLTYRDLEARSRSTGGHLARSTLASTLRRNALPRQEFVEAMVRACGLDPAPWARARRRLAVLHAAAEPAADRAPGARGTAPRQLPPAPPVLVGRDAELGRLARMLGAAPVTVISGPPGAGKTAVGVRAAHLVADRFPDGQLYVDLRGTAPNDEPLTPAEIAGVLLRSLGEGDARAAADAGEAAGRLRTALSGRRVLIMLDDVASAAQVRWLAPCGGGSAVLLTSRATLTSLDGSRHVRLGALPPDRARQALELFLGAERVRGEPEAVRTLADLCDRLPLALRIAAARLAARPEWPVRALVERMADPRRRLDELRVDDMDMRASLAVSFADLARGRDEAARLAVRVLGLPAEPPDGQVRTATAASLLDVPPDSAERALERLVDVGLAESSAPGRYRVPGLVRLFALEPNGRREPAVRRRQRRPAPTRSGGRRRSARRCSATAPS